MNSSAKMLMGSPNFPNDHGRGGKGAPKSRRQIRQPIVMEYENRIESTPSELMAFSATYDPILMRDSSVLMTKDTETARNGIFHPSETRESQPEPGKP